MPSTLFRPSDELVAVAWLKAIPYIGGRAATMLPRDNASWSASGFVTTQAAGGSPDIELPISRPMLSVHAWGAPTDGAGRPPWNQAAQLLEAVTQAALDHWPGGTGLGRGKFAMPSGYYSAFIHQVIPRTEPRRIEGDPSSYAHFQMDLEIRWTAGP